MSKNSWKNVVISKVETNRKFEIKNLEPAPNLFVFATSEAIFKLSLVFLYENLLLNFRDQWELFSKL